MPLIVDGISGTFWGSRWRKSISLTAGMISAILVAWTQIKANADDLLHLVPTSQARIAQVEAQTSAVAAKQKEHEEADKAVSARVERVVSRMEHSVNDGKREAAQNDLFKAGLEMKKAVKADDEDTQQYIQKEIIRLQATLSKLDAATETLNKATGKE